ncbi:MAG TPA: STM3941 family protein [Longimicrobiaceae bacterium]|nr:STM3941 family protein [Longimicrobiaceae bacterium]
MEPLVIRSQRLRWALLTVAALVFVVIGAVLVVSGENVFMGLLGVGFFGLCAVVSARQALDARPRIVIDDEGVFDRTLRVGRIAWSDIAAAYVKRMHSGVFVCLELRDPAKYVHRQPPLLQRVTGLNTVLGFTHLSLNLTNTCADPEHVCAVVVREARLRQRPFAHSDLTPLGEPPLPH